MEVYLFKNDDPVLFRKRLEEAVDSKRQGAIQWNATGDQVRKMGNQKYVGWFHVKGNTTSLLIDTNCYDVLSALAESLSSPWLSVRFQEKSFWEASLCVGRERKSDFSTSPTQWGKAAAKNFFCDPAVLSGIWEVSVEKFERYLIDWGLTEYGSKNTR